MARSGCIEEGHHLELAGCEIDSESFLFDQASPAKCSLQATCSGSNFAVDVASCATFVTTVSFLGVGFAIFSTIQPTYEHHQSHFAAYSLDQNVMDFVAHSYFVDNFTVPHSRDFEQSDPSYTCFS